MYVISFLKPEEIERMGGLPSIGICGSFRDKSMDPDKFLVNREFVDFMHDIIGDKGCELSSLKEAAKKQKNGYLYVIDFRTPEGIMGNVPPEDIIGAFKVVDQMVVTKSYKRNELHKIFTKNGLVKLPPELLLLVVNEIKARQQT